MYHNVKHSQLTSVTKGTRSRKAQYNYQLACMKRHAKGKATIVKTEVDAIPDFNNLDNVKPVKVNRRTYTINYMR